MLTTYYDDKNESFILEYDYDDFPWPEGSDPEEIWESIDQMMEDLGLTKIGEVDENGNILPE